MGPDKHGQKDMARDMYFHNLSRRTQDTALKSNGQRSMFLITSEQFITTRWINTSEFFLR